MNYGPDFSESFYRSHARRYAEVSHNFIQSVYSDVSHPSLKGYTDLIDRLQELVPTGSQVLDTGCGSGVRDTFFYWQRGYDILGVDAVEENILGAHRLHPEIASRVSVADLRKPLDYSDGSFDLVLCNAVIQHIEPETALGVTLPEFARILRAGGVLQLMFKYGDGVATVYDRDYGADRTFQTIRSGRSARHPGGTGLEGVPRGGREAGRSHVLQGPQADGSLRLFRAEVGVS